MRAAHVLMLCGLMVAAGLVLTFARSLTTDGPAPTLSTSTASRPTPTSPLPLSSEHDVASATPTTTGLVCIEEALGGVQALAAVSSLRIVGTTTRATAGHEPGPAGVRLEIGVEFPDRYRFSTMQTPAPPTHGTRLVFARQMLMRLPRELAGVRLFQRKTSDSGPEPVAIVASGMDGELHATLLADPRTCVPIAFEYIAPAIFRGWDQYRVELSEYRRFGGILFPTVLRTARNGEPWEAEVVSDIQVNPPLGDAYFRSGGGTR